MEDEDRRRGFRNKIMVDTTALQKLLEDYERMDSFAKSESDMHASLEHKLYNVLHALYSENHDSERLMSLIMDILKPMIAKRIMIKTLNAIYNR